MAYNLLEDLYGNIVEQSELEQLLLTHFGGCRSESHEEIHYSHAGKQGPALILKYTKDGELSEICTGSAIFPTDVESIRAKVEQQLLKPSEPEIGQIVLFANLPTVGWFRYRDDFQLVPMPANAPRPQCLIGDHPLLLQYRVEGSTDFHISMLRRTRTGRELDLLFTALTTVIQGSIGNVARFHWSLVNGNDPANLRSEYCQEAYTWPDANGIAPSYAPQDGIDPIGRTPAAEHYTRVGINPGHPLDLPDILEQLLATYFGMPRESRDRFMRASFWFQYAQRVGGISHSGAFTALVSAVEALIPDAKPDAHCRACDRPIGLGPTKKFIAFVEEHAPEPAITKERRRQLYSLRSALSHGGHLLHSDRYGWGGGMTSTQLSEWSDQRAMWQVVRLVLVNWLLARNAK